MKIAAGLRWSTHAQMTPRYRKSRQRPRLAQQPDAGERRPEVAGQKFAPDRVVTQSGEGRRSGVIGALLAYLDEL
jgi:hypothetical protein